MFYHINSAKIPLNKRAKSVEELKKLRDRINSTCDYAKVELLRSVSGPGEEITIVESFHDRAAWVKYGEDQKVHEILGEYITEIKTVLDRVDSHSSFAETIE